MHYIKLLIFLKSYKYQNCEDIWPLKYAIFQTLWFNGIAKLVYNFINDITWQIL